MRRLTRPAGRPTAGIRSFKRSAGHSLRWKRPLTRMAGDGPTSPKSQKLVREENMKRLIASSYRRRCLRRFAHGRRVRAGQAGKDRHHHRLAGHHLDVPADLPRARAGLLQERGLERQDHRVPWRHRLGARHDRRCRRRRRHLARRRHRRHQGRPAAARVLRRLQHGGVRLVCGQEHQEHGRHQGQALRHFARRLVDRSADPLRA